MRRRAPVPREPAAGEGEGAHDGRGEGPRVGLVSLGCPKNLVDSELMLGLLKRSGAQLVTDARRADVVVVNTCGFIESARRESVETILEMAQLKEGHPGRRLVVAGCLVQRHALELRREIPEIDALLGTGEIERVVEAVAGGRDGAEKAAPPEPTWLHDRETPRELSTPEHLAYLKIGDGCDYRCAFCIIPRLRGRYRSRALDDVVAEAERLVERGVRELVLVAQDTTRYGADLRMRDGLARLLRRLGRLAELRWIRVMYAHPTTLSDALLEAMAGEEKVVKYLDVPLQHASARVLRRMRRPSGHARVMGLVERIRRRVPGVALRSSFIVGFPGETARDFEELLGFVREAALDHVGVFTYSREEGTAAQALAGEVPARTKASRQGRLMRLQQKISGRRNAALVGSRQTVLVDGTDRVAGRLVGRLPTQAPEIDGCVILEGRAHAGAFVTCEITAAGPYDLAGRIAAPATSR